MKRQQKKFREILGILSQDVLSQDDIRKIKHSVNRQSCLPGHLKETIKRITNHSGYSINLGYSISTEQSVFAINWLREKLFKKNGQLRQNTGSFGHREIEIINNFKEFKFVGFWPLRNGLGEIIEYAILYKTIDKKGNSFVYTGVYFESIEIVN